MTSAEFVQHLVGDARLAIYVAGVALLVAFFALVAALQRKG